MGRPTQGVAFPRSGAADAAAALAAAQAAQVDADQALVDAAAAQVDADQALSDAADAQADATAALSQELNDLTDVNAPSPSDGDALTWDSGTSKWVAAAAGAPSLDLDDLGDVTAPSPSSGEVLSWNGSAWVNAASSGDTGALVTGFAFGYEADAGIGVSDGSPVTNWDDSSASDYDLTEGTNGPTFRAADADDGLPYVEFDGSNDILQAVRGAGLYTGTDMTFFMVYRAPVNGASNGVICFSESGENMSSGNRPFAQVGTDGRVTLTYNATGHSYSGDFIHSTQWTVLAFRCDVRMGRAVVTFIDGGYFKNSDQASTSLTALDWDRFRVGAQYNNFGGAGNFARIDVRAIYVYESGLSETNMRSMLRYLRNKWKADAIRGI